MALRLGILGGSFNPPHAGHLVCALQARAQLGLDRVLLMPVGVAPHKETPDDPGAPARVELCRLAFDGIEGLEVSTLEADREGPSYTVATLAELHALEPGAELTFIAGGDMARSLPSWREPERVLELATFAVAEREGVRRDDVSETVAGLAGAERIRFFDMPRMDVSSSLVRSYVAEGRPIRGLVPDTVAAHIERKELYRTAPAVSA